MSAPSKRTLPPMEGHRPTSKRASVVFPAAEGPTTANTSPGLKANCTPRTMATCWPGAPAIKPSTFKKPLGAGSVIASGLTGTWANNNSSRPQAPRALTTLFHCATNWLRGANTLPPNTEPMIIMLSPPLSMLCKNSHAPKPKSNEDMICCTALDMAVQKPAPFEAVA